MTGEIMRPEDINLYDTVASMRPRQNDRGNSMPTAPGLRSSTGFNEAPAE